MAGIRANSASVTMTSDAVDNTQAGYVTNEQITLLTNPTGSSWSWGLAKPSGATSRSDLSGTTAAGPTFTPDVAGTWTITCTVDSSTVYTLRVTVTAVAVTSVANGHRFSPVANASIPTPALGETLFVSTTDGLATKDTTGAVTGISASAVERGSIVRTGGGAQSSIGTSYVKVTGWTANGSSSANVVPDYTANEITINSAGTYELSYCCSFSGTANTTFHMAAATDDVASEADGALERKIGAGGDVGSASFCGEATVTAGQTISVYVKADGGGKNITIEHARLTVRKVSG
jgi:hypothetical protein